jgi:plasmid stabilization system protein ParE
MVELRWTDEAQTWLRDIFDYIASDNPQAAARVVEGIYAHAQVLLGFPDVGYRYRQVEEGEIRILLYGHYRIAYLHRSDKTSVDILGVFHGTLDIDRYFP